MKDESASGVCVCVCLEQEKEVKEREREREKLDVWKRGRCFVAAKINQNRSCVDWKQIKNKFIAISPLSRSNRWNRFSPCGLHIVESRKGGTKHEYVASRCSVAEPVFDEHPNDCAKRVHRRRRWVTHDPFECCSSPNCTVKQGNQISFLIEFVFIKFNQKR